MLRKLGEHGDEAFGFPSVDLSVHEDPLEPPGEKVGRVAGGHLGMRARPLRQSLGLGLGYVAVGNHAMNQTHHLGEPALYRPLNL